jgi:threonylcarbamoyladenosine tRNA methylthiotransferase MtaB
MTKNKVELGLSGSNSAFFLSRGNAMPTVSFRTFGCKLNQAETAMVAGQFIRRGYETVGPEDAADVVFIHTCTVTGRSDAKCRQAVHHALALNPGATVIVAGCYSQVSAGELAGIPGVDYVLGTEEKLRPFDFFPGPGKLAGSAVSVSPLAVHRKTAAYEAGVIGPHTRAFLKIQGGCSRACAYCIVPAARGPSRSEAPGDVVRNAETLVRRGFREIVVTGTHLGDYGREHSSGPFLPELIERILEISGLERLRLSSLDPDEVSPELIRTVERHDRICRHFHISLQSGSDSVLKAMNRPCGTEEFRGIAERLVRIFGTPGLGTDVITGFPGETDAQFVETARFIESLPFSYLHVFPFSPRKGTAAESMPRQVPPEVRIERAHILRGIGLRKKREFSEKWIGKTVQVLMEGAVENGRMSGFTSEYLRVEAEGDASMSNRIVPVRVEALSGKGAKGAVLTGC